MSLTLPRRLDRLLPGAAARRRRRMGLERVPLIETGRFRLAAVAILKNETTYIEEWLCHHLAVGVEHFFLYDNGSTDDFASVIRPYVNHGIVTPVYFPLRGGQRDAYNHALRFFGGACDWMAFFDLDEFLVPRADEDVPTILDRFTDAEQVLVARREFCFSGHRSRPSGLVTEEYTLASDNVPRVGTSVVLAKSIVRPPGVYRVGIHSVTTVHGRTIDTARRPAPEGRPIDTHTYARLQINHYYTKSWDEFQVKLGRATTSTHAFQLPPVPFDIPAEPDLTVQRWVPRTKAWLETMGQLSPTPYRYGSHLRLSGFHVFDQLSIVAAGVISNEIAGLERPRKQRSFNSLPMPGVRGALARCDDHGYSPAVGRFMASVHTRQALDWLGSEVSWDLCAGGEGLEVGSGSLEHGADARRLTVAGTQAGLTIPVGGPPLRCHAILFAIRLPGDATVTIDTDAGDGAWEAAATFPLTGAGAYLGIIALDKRPRTIERVRLTLGGIATAEIYDLALASFG